MAGSTASRDSYISLVIAVNAFSGERQHSWATMDSALSAFESSLVGDDTARMVRPTICNLMGEFAYGATQWARDIGEGLINRANSIFQYPIQIELNEPVRYTPATVPSASEDNAIRVISTQAREAWKTLGECLDRAKRDAERDLETLLTSYNAHKDYLGEGKFPELLHQQFLDLSTRETDYCSNLEKFSRYMYSIGDYVEKLLNESAGF